MNLLSRKESPRDYDGRKSGVTSWGRSVRPVKGRLCGQKPPAVLLKGKESPRTVQRAAATEALRDSSYRSPRPQRDPPGPGSGSEGSKRLLPW